MEEKKRGMEYSGMIFDVKSHCEFVSNKLYVTDEVFSWGSIWKNCETSGIDGLVDMKLTFGIKALGIRIRIRRENKVLIVFSFSCTSFAISLELVSNYAPFLSNID